MGGRGSLIERARKLVEDIEVEFATIEHWNRTHPDEEPLDPDPDGALERMRDKMLDMLRRENVRTAPPQEERDEDNDI